VAYARERQLVGRLAWDLPVAYSPCTQGFTTGLRQIYKKFTKSLQRRLAMQTIRRWVWVAVALAMGVFLFVGRQVFATPADGREADREAINSVLSAQQTAWNRGDVDAFLVGYWRSPELTFSGSSGVARGWDGVLARYKKNYPNRAAMGQLTFSDLEFRFLGPDAALVLGLWHLKREKDDVGGVFTLVWQRLPDGWKIIHDHTSAVAATKTSP
jgi:uncharacterized protein (TIGR02246 family)